MRAESKPVGSNIPKPLFPCCCRFDSCRCLETHVCGVIFLNFDLMFGTIHSATCLDVIHQFFFPLATNLRT